MRFIVTDRDSIEHGTLVRCDYVVISIHDPDKRPACVPRQPGLRDVLYLTFHDAGPVPGGELPEGIVPMTEDQARQAWAFVREWEGRVEAVVVQCEQGMSRSPAVAAALCRAYGGCWESYFQDYQPNRHAHSMMLKTRTVVG